MGIRGTVGGLTFDKNGNVRQKQGSNKARFDSATSMARTRENASEFGAAGSAGKVLRQAVRGAIQGAADRLMVPRLTKLMRSIIGQDTTNARGLRQVLKAHIGALVGFDFNANAHLGSTFFAPYTFSSLTAGAFDLQIDAITPTNDLSAPAGATHYEIVAAAAKVNFSTGAVTIADVMDVPGVQPIDGSSASNQNTSFGGLGSLSGEDVLVVVMGVNFYQEVNGEQYQLNAGAFTPVAVVKAS